MDKKWQSGQLPPCDMYYWVTDGESSWLAVRREQAAGGWSNDDTWEDWESEVIAWSQIEAPPYLPV